MANRTPSPPPADPAQLLRSKSYVAVLAFGALLGVPVAVVAFLYLKLVAEAQTWVFTTLPGDLGFSAEPAWWPLLPLTLSGLVVALSLRYLPGTGGHKPAEGFVAGGPVLPIELPGVILASFATLSLGVVLGPEAPLIAVGSGMGVLAVRLLKRDAPETAVTVIGAAGSFAAISTLLGSPLVGAFLLMEASGIGGSMMGVVLVPDFWRRGSARSSSSASTAGPATGRSRWRFPTFRRSRRRRSPSFCGRSGSVWPRSCWALPSAGRRWCCSRSSSSGWWC